MSNLDTMDGAQAVGAQAEGPRPTVLLSTVSSDSHTWNLVYLELLLRENGFEVVNLGACVPDELLVSAALRVRPDAVVISSVNGHGGIDGERVIGRLRAEAATREVPAVIGGKLGITGESGGEMAGRLERAGFDVVFGDDDPALLVATLHRLIAVANSSNVVQGAFARGTGRSGHLVGGVAA